MQETQVRSLGQEDPLKEEMATHSRMLAWKISQTEGLGGLQSMGSQRVRHNLVTEHTQTREETSIVPRTSQQPPVPFFITTFTEMLSPYYCHLGLVLKAASFCIIE